MNKTKCHKISLFCRNFTRWFLLIFSLLIITFALLSGAQGFGSGIKGIIKNAPNTLPWLILFIINYIVWKHELLGSIILAAFAVASALFFGAFSGNFFALFAIFFPLLILAGLLLLYHFCSLRNQIPESSL